MRNFQIKHGISDYAFHTTQGVPPGCWVDVASKIVNKQFFFHQTGKMDEAARLMNNLLQRDTNLKSLLGATKEEQVKRLKERLEKRKQRQAAGMSEDQIEELESQEDKQFEEDVTKETTGNALEDLQVFFCLRISNSFQRRIQKSAKFMDESDFESFAIISLVFIKALLRVFCHPSTRL